MKQILFSGLLALLGSLSHAADISVDSNDSLTVVIKDLKSTDIQCGKLAVSDGKICYLKDEIVTQIEAQNKKFSSLAFKHKVHACTSGSAKCVKNESNSSKLSRPYFSYIVPKGESVNIDDMKIMLFITFVGTL